MPSHNAHQFRICRFLGIPIVVERFAVPHCSDSPGRWRWSRWRLCSFGNTHFVSKKLEELDRG